MSERSCAILLKANPGAKAWEFISYTLREEVAWRSAEMYLLDERAHGHARARVIVVLREDYDAGRIKPLPAPKGFALALKVLPDVVEVDEFHAAEVKEPAPEVKKKPPAAGRLLEEI